MRIFNVIMIAVTVFGMSLLLIPMSGIVIGVLGKNLF
jgi:hypothetical protein